jgi:D-amino-acid dehydrogenase
LASALLVAAQHHQALHIERERVERLILQNGRVMGVQTHEREIHAGRVIIAGGAWSAVFGTQLGCTVPVEPQRGQIIHLSLPETDTSQWTIVEAFHGHYMVCWQDRRVVAGATRETGSGFVPQATAAGVHEVLGEALRVAPGLRGAVVGEIRVGLRPRTADNMPILGGVPQVEGVYLCTGHGASGLQLGPFSGKLAAEWAMGKPAEQDISAFHVGRFFAS